VVTLPCRKNAVFTPPSGPSIAGKLEACNPSSASWITAGPEVDGEVIDVGV
jgi:hypothetical protein